MLVTVIVISDESTLTTIFYKLQKQLDLELLHFKNVLVELEN